MNQDEVGIADAVKTINPKDAKHIYRRRSSIKRILTKGFFRSLFIDATLMLEMVCDYVTGRCPHVPFFSIAVAVAALAYLLNPADLIWDPMPGGWLDDFVAINFALGAIESDLYRYREWKRGQKKGKERGEE